MLIGLYSPKGTYDATFLANYANINLVDELVRSPGIAMVYIYAVGQYATRIWVKPDTLGRLGITIPDIVNAVKNQNTVNPAGQIGSEPVPPGQELLIRSVLRVASSPRTIRLYRSPRQPRRLRRPVEGRSPDRIGRPRFTICGAE